MLSYLVKERDAHLWTSMACQTGPGLTPRFHEHVGLLAAADISGRGSFLARLRSHGEIFINLPRLKRVLKPYHVDPFTAEPDSFQLETCSLLLCGCSSELYLATSAQHSVPR